MKTFLIGIAAGLALTSAAFGAGTKPRPAQAAPAAAVPAPVTPIVEDPEDAYDFDAQAVKRPPRSIYPANIQGCALTARAVARSIGAAPPELNKLGSAFFELDGNFASLSTFCDPVSVEIAWEKGTSAQLMARIIARAGATITFEAAAPIEAKVNECIAGSLKPRQHYVMHELHADVGLAHVDCGISDDGNSSVRIRVKGQVPWQ